MRLRCAVFRSALDSWSIGQLFPILPIHRLDEEPTVAATLADLTCGEAPQTGSPRPCLPQPRVCCGMLARAPACNRDSEVPACGNVEYIAREDAQHQAAAGLTRS